METELGALSVDKFLNSTSEINHVIVLEPWPPGNVESASTPINHHHDNHFPHIHIILALKLPTN